MRYKVGDKVKIKEGSLAGNIYTISYIDSCGYIELSGLPYDFFDYELELVAPTLTEIKEKKLTCVVHTPTRDNAEIIVNTIPVNDEGTIDCDWSSFWDTYKDNTCYTIVDGELYSYQNKEFFEDNSYTIYEFSDLFPVGSTMICGDRIYQRTESGITNYKLVPEYKEGRDENHFCNGFRGGKKPAYVNGGLVRIHDVDTHELWTTPFIIPKDKLDALVDAWAKLGCTTFNLMPDEVKEVIKKTEEKKMPTKFTFYVTEGYRIDKSNNTKIPTMTTEVLVNGKDYQYSGSATCDKTNFDERADGADVCSILHY